jgi:pyridoxine 5-phosphate synthase
VIRYRSSLKDPVELLRQGGITVSLFVDPDLEQIKAARRLGADYIEIHTGAYCEARAPGSRRIELDKIDNAVRAGRKLGLGVNAGHGLNYQNVREVVALGGIEEFNIGHSIVSRAVLVGMERAVREMAALVRGG